MFGLFKRTQVEDWEKTFLINVFSQLPNYTRYKVQIKEGLLSRVMIDSRDNYVGFSYNPDLSSKFENRKERSFKIVNIEVFSITNNKFITAEIYLAGGLVCGYTLSNPKDKIDLLRIKTDNFKIEFLDDETDILNKLLNKEELSLINPSDFYEVNLNNKLYYHIKDEEDGDFIGIDNEKKVYMITHDPMEITPLNKSLIEVLRA